MESMTFDPPAEVLPLADLSPHPADGTIDLCVDSLPIKLGSCGGHGTLEILRVTQALEENSIPCCLVGTSALIYYGANRVRGDWHISVPTHQLLDASSLLKSYPHSCDFRTAPPYAVQPRSLTHIYPRFKLNAINVFFQILPSQDCHFDCEPSNLVRSQKGLPYPKLDVYIQSLVDTHDAVALCDIVDGTDVTEDWGNKNLDLSGTTDANWIKWKNEAIRAQEGSWNVFCLVETTVVTRRQIWEEVVRGKKKRLGFKRPEALFATRFRLRGSEDPWLKDRHAA